MLITNKFKGMSLIKSYFYNSVGWLLCRGSVLYNSTGPHFLTHWNVLMYPVSQKWSDKPQLEPAQDGNQSLCLRCIITWKQVFMENKNKAFRHICSQLFACSPLSVKWDTESSMFAAHILPLITVISHREQIWELCYVKTVFTVNCTYRFWCLNMCPLTLTIMVWDSERESRQDERPIPSADISTDNKDALLFTDHNDRI